MNITLSIVINVLKNLLKMVKITTQKLCKTENKEAFFKRMFTADAVSHKYTNKNGEEKTQLVALKGKIFLDQMYTVEFHDYEGHLYISLDIKSLEDKKRLREYRKLAHNADPQGDL